LRDRLGRRLCYLYRDSLRQGMLSMNWFLAKTDPGTYSIDDLARDGVTAWDGVTNAQAVSAIRAMRPGDRVFIYHSGGESAVVGIAAVKSRARDDPKNPKSAIVDLKFTARVDPPMSLAEIRKSRRFDDWALVRQGRLSTMAAPASFAAWMRSRYPKLKALRGISGVQRRDA
jgi:predicted RNA-binding protein with PUA-like domain